MENPDIKTNEQLLTEIEQLKKKVAKLEKVEQELQSTKTHYNDFINSSTDAVGYWKAPKGLKTNLPIKDQIEMLCQMVCLDANKACWKGKGLKSKKDVIGKKYIDLIKNKMADESFLQFINNNYQLNDHEFYQTFPGGKKHYSLESWYGVIKNGMLTHLWASSKDITKLKLTEKTLLAKEKQMYSIYNTVTDIIFYLTVEKKGQYRFESINDAFTKAIGISKKAVIGKLVTEIIPEPSLSLALSKYKEAIDKKTTVKWEETTMYPTGIKSAAVNITPIFDNEGNCIHLVGSVHDLTERKLAEQAKKISDVRWQFAIDGSDLGLWDWNMQTNEVFFSKRWKSMLGFKDNEIQGSLDEWDKRIHPDDKEKVLADLNNYLEGKSKTYSNEHRVSCKDNSYKWILDRGKVVSKTKDGKPLRMIGTHTDITAQKKHIEIIKENESKLSEAQTIAQLGTYFLDLTKNTFTSTPIFDNIVEINETDNKTFGLWESLIHPSDFDEIRAVLDNSIKTREIFDITHKIRTSNKTGIKWVRSIGKVGYKEDVPIKITGTIQDVSKQKLIESEIIVAKEKIEKSKEYLDNIINNIGDPLFVKDDQSRLLLVNDAFCTLFKLSKAEIIGKTLAENVTPDERESFLKIDKQVIANGQENINEELLTLRGKKSKILSTRKNRFIERDGNKFLIGTIRDITKRKIIEEELSKHREHLEELVIERTKDLEQKNSELDEAINVFVGRELKIRKLENEIKTLKEKK